MGGVNALFSDETFEAELDEEMYDRLYDALPDEAKGIMYELITVDNDAKKIFFASSVFDQGAVHTRQSANDAEINAFFAFLQSNCPWSVSNVTLPEEFYATLYMIFGEQTFYINLINDADSESKTFQVTLETNCLEWSDDD